MRLAKAAEKVFSLIKETVEQQNVRLWDVTFVKEGASYYLRVFIDSDEGISIDDCTNVSHAIDPIIDEADPIDVSYYLEVCSPGIERELTRDEHFAQMVGRPITIKLFKARDGVKEFCGTLADFNGEIVVETENETLTFSRNEVAKANLLDFDC